MFFCRSSSFQEDILNQGNPKLQNFLFKNKINSTHLFVFN